MAWYNSLYSGIKNLITPKSSTALYGAIEGPAAQIKYAPSSLGIEPGTNLSPEAVARLSNPLTPATQRITKQVQQPFIESAQQKNLQQALGDTSSLSKESISRLSDTKTPAVQRIFNPEPPKPPQQTTTTFDGGGGFTTERITNYNPFTTKVSSTGELLTGLGGFGGFSAGQFGGGTGVSGIPGGASLLPGSLGGLFRTAGGLPLLTEEEENKKKQNIVTQGKLSLGGLTRDLFGIPTATAETGETPTQGGARPSIDGRFFGNVATPLFGRGPNVPTQIGPNLAPDDVRNNLYFNFLNNQQRELVGGIAPPGGTLSQQFVGPGGALEPGPITGQEFSKATTGKAPVTPLKPNDTKLATLDNIKNRSAGILADINNVNQGLVNETTQKAQQAAFEETLSASGGYFKTADPTSGQINVAKFNSDGSTSWVSPQEFEQAGLDIGNLPDAAKLGSDYQQKVNTILGGLIDTTTGRPYTKEDFDLPEQPADSPFKADLDKLQKDIQDFRNKFDFNFDIESERNQVIKDEGLATLRSQKKTLNENINAILGVYEGLADEVRNDPDFTKNLKGRRLEFISTEQKRALTGFQRQLEILNDDIKVAEDRVSSRMKDKIDTYSIKFNQLKDLEAQEEKLKNQINKATDDARSLFTTYLTQFGGTEWGGLPKEVQDSIKAEFTRLGAPHLVKTLEAGLKTQKDKQLALNALNAINRTPVGVNINLGGMGLGGLGLGDNVQGRYVPRGTAGLSDIDADNLNTDIGNALGAIATVQNSADDVAVKNQKIGAIAARLQTTYASNKTALGIINTRVPSSAGIYTQNVGLTTNARDIEFGKDVASELALIKSRFRKGAEANKALGRLLSKYGADYESKIRAELKSYLE